MDTLGVNTRASFIILELWHTKRRSIRNTLTPMMFEIEAIGCSAWVS